MDSKKIWGTLDPFYESGAILGRKVANTSFLDALFRADPFDEYHFFPGAMKACENLRQNISARFPKLLASGRIKIFDRRELPRRISLQPYFCFHQSDCILYPPHLANVRNRYSKTIFPITSTTHSLSYSNYGQSFLTHLWAGTTSRDCIVSTSRPGVKVVENFFTFLRRGYGLDEKEFPSPQIKRIPLAINPLEFIPPTEAEKHEASARLKFTVKDGNPRLNILVFGRISHFSKMDILPLFRALRKCFASGISTESVRLVLAGWMDSGDQFHKTLEDLARNIGLQLVIIPSPSDSVRLDLYRSADIFVSIADNPQETFGITVIEAMAMGIPAVVSDYDGYRDLVVNNETGLRVPTLGPCCTSSTDIMAPLIFDNNYHLQIAQTTAVETPALASALSSLITSPDTRTAMGDKGIQRVRETYSWDRVISRYVDLWHELNTKNVDEDSVRKTTHPVHLPFGEVFEHYPTRSISPELMVAAGETGQAIYRKKEFPLIYKGMEHIIDDSLIPQIAFFARKPLSVADLTLKIESVSEETDMSDTDFRTEKILNNILWCIKHDILELV